MQQSPEEDHAKDDYSKKPWNKSDRKPRPMIGLALSQKHIKHVSEVVSVKELWNKVLNMFECHTLFNMLVPLQTLYNVTIQWGGKVTSGVNQMNQQTGILRSMSVKIDDKDMTQTELNVFSSGSENLIASHALWNEYRLCPVEFVKSKLLHK